MLLETLRRAVRDGHAPTLARWWSEITDLPSEMRALHAIDASSRLSDCGEDVAVECAVAGGMRQLWQFPGRRSPVPDGLLEDAAAVMLRLDGQDGCDADAACRRRWHRSADSVLRRRLFRGLGVCPSNPRTAVLDLFAEPDDKRQPLDWRQNVSCGFA